MDTHRLRAFDHSKLSTMLKGEDNLGANGHQGTQCLAPWPAGCCLFSKLQSHRRNPPPKVNAERPGIWTITRRGFLCFCNPRARFSRSWIHSSLWLAPSTLMFATEGEANERLIHDLCDGKVAYTAGGHELELWQCCSIRVLSEEGQEGGWKFSVLDFVRDVARIDWWRYPAS